MKRILFVLSVLISSVTYSQTTGFFRYDTVTFQKIGGNSEFKLLNATRGVTGGVLTNMGNGRTAFVMPSAGTVTAANEGVRLSGTTVQLGNLVALSQYTPLTLNGFPLSINHNGVNTAAQSDSNTLRFTNNTTATTITDSLVSPGSSWRVASRIFLGASQYVDFRQDVVAGGSGGAYWRLKAKAGAAGYTTIFQIRDNGFIPDNLNLAGSYIGNAPSSASLRWGEGAVNYANNASITGGFNIGIGRLALANVTSGGINIAIGAQAMELNTVGRYNTAIGISSLGLADTSYNTAVGAFAMQGTTTGSQNAAFGANSLLFNTTGQKNNAFGAGAMEANTTGNNNAGLGHDVMLHNITGGNNTSVGYLSLATITAGSGNVALGYTAGNTMTTGDSAIFIGATAGTHGSQGLNAGNSIAIGYNTFTTGPNQIVIGNANHVSAKMFGIASGSAPRVLLYNATTKEIFHADTAGFGGGGSGGSGTVTSVDLAYGITGSTDPITTTGTVIADTTILVNKAGAQVISGAKNFTATTNQFRNATFNNQHVNLLTLGSVSGLEAYPGIWFGTATPDLTNYAFLGDVGGGNTIVNGSNQAKFRVANNDIVSISGTGMGIFNTSPSVPLDVTGNALISGSLNIKSNLVGVGGVYHTDLTNVGNVGAGEDNLMTKSVTAGLLAVDKEFLEFTLTFTVSANVDIKVYFGATQLVLFSATAANSNYHVTGRIYRTGAATQKAFGEVYAGTTFVGAFRALPTETLSGAITFRSTGEGTSNDDVVQTSNMMKWFPAK